MGQVRDPYDVIAEYYDLEFDAFTEDVDLYLAFAQRAGTPVLELGCGTGRLLLPLARAGFEVEGVDRSAAMLARAAERLNRHGLSHVRLRQADVTDLSELPERHYSLVVLAVNGFLHLLDRAAQVTALEQIHRVLRPGGLLLLDVLHPTPAQLEGWEGHLLHDASWALPDGSLLDRFSARRVSPAEQTIETWLFYDRRRPDGTLTRDAVTYVLRYVHRFELELLLEGAGFRIEAIYGSYQLDPLEDESPLMLVVAVRA
ncbi:methyltransferase domain-containing protein [Thermomicrobiaceae bacterium CFH 74404]|uniref:Methyltransferase domain-containing protein n=1 Tax=Thermalbibacter longus TaxID=2951981 RepID=A0AA41WC14_9BACT|nr:class I SAM-dependent methyltransferase [Thermalbibacter longus]MCM8747639.1 methyltransferase domain-containing protein [Thermalbibacter longus]